MTAELLSLILDFVILVALVGTIYYALHLSRSLNNFKKHRDDMKAMINDLAKNIDEAQTAIEGLKAASHVAADNLDDVLHDSKKMAEELKMINETSNSLANRLENISSGKGLQRAAQQYESFDAYEEDDFEDDEEPQADDSVIEPPSFFIQDREFEEETGDFGDDMDDDADLSRAERELLEALHGQKQGQGGR